MPITEIKSERKLKSKTFSDSTRPSNEFIANVHVGQIHYDNKLGVGDGVKGLRELDWDLQWDSVRRGWYFEHHSFQPFIPEYADGWAEFRDLYCAKDQTIMYRPVCAHVKGVLVKSIDGLSNVNAVIYKDAFGTGVDLIYCFLRSALQKIVRIREGYYPVTDVYFDFEVFLPSGKDVFKNTVDTKLDITKENIFYSDRILIGNEQGDYKECFTVIRSPKVWDSSDHKQSIRVDCKDAYSYTEVSKVYLRKHIPVSFFKKAIGDVYTDTTTSPIYSGVGDGHCNDFSPVTWAAAHDFDGAGSEDGNTSFKSTAVADVTGGAFEIFRGYMPFDTDSSLPDVCSIVAASLFVNSRTLYEGVNDAYSYIVAVETNTAGTGQLVDGDYDECGYSAGSGWSNAKQTDIVEASNHLDIGDDLTAGAVAEFVFTVAGIGMISKTSAAWTQMGLRTGHDMQNTQPADVATATGVRWEASEQAGTGDDPYLSITYSSGGVMTTNKGYWGTIG